MNTTRRNDAKNLFMPDGGVHDLGRMRESIAHLYGADRTAPATLPVSEIRKKQFVGR